MVASAESAYRERIWPGPVAVAAVISFAATVAVAYGAAYGADIGWLTFGCATVACCIVLLPAAPKVEVTPTHLQAGRARIERELLGRSATVTRARMSQMRREPEFATAHWVVPPWVRTAVAVVISDASDPHPMWIIGTRRPQLLHEALGIATSNNSGH